MALRFHSAVAAELGEIYGWYVERNPSLATRLKEDIEAALRRIESYPQLYARIEGLRRLQLARFPCHLYYHCTAHGDVIVVGAAHAHSDPDTVLGRFAHRT
jgi:plasmid stabilization system protein ParE